MDAGLTGCDAGFLPDREVALRERLPFVLPDFNRHSWVSEAARAVWEPRLTRIARAWLDIEWLSVATRARPCALIWLSPQELPRLTPKWEGAQLSAIQLEIEGAHFGGAAPATAPEGLICVAVGDLDKLECLRRAWVAADNDGVGELLGYPPCCRAAFRKIWLDRREIDTTWSMAENTHSPDRNTITIALSEDAPPFANILWRWIGVRAVPHLPCRFDCDASNAFGRRLLGIGRDAGYAQETEWTDEILRWPVEWSALHGIAEIKTPLLKISTRTDATAEKWVVRWSGTRYPAEGAVGLKFPYVAPHKPMLTRSRGFQQGLAHGARHDTRDAAADGAREAVRAVASDAAPGANAEAWRYADNGFGSSQAMEELHRPIVTLARAALAHGRGNVLDLGCGNGLLLSKICDGSPHLIPHGIDSNAGVIEHGRLLHPQFVDNFVAGDLFDTALWADGAKRYTLALIMIGRLIEVAPEKAMRVVERLRATCSRVLGYAYSDWREDELDAIALRFGLVFERSISRTAGFLKPFEDQ